MDPSADIAAWTAVLVAILSVAASLVLYWLGQKASRDLYKKGVDDAALAYQQAQADAARERTKAHDIETLTRILDLLTEFGGTKRVDLISSLYDTLSDDTVERTPSLADVLELEGSNEVALGLRRSHGEVLGQLQVAIIQTVNT